MWPMLTCHGLPSDIAAGDPTVQAIGIRQTLHTQYVPHCSTHQAVHLLNF